MNIHGAPVDRPVRTKHRLFSGLVKLLLTFAIAFWDSPAQGQTQDEGSSWFSEFWGRLTSSSESRVAVPDPNPDDGSNRWLTELSEAYARAQKRKQPILVRAGAEWCVWCKKLDKEIEQPDVQRGLEDWTLVYLDLDHHGKEARQLGIGPIPALRIITSMGSTVASHDGFLPAAQLLEFLKQHRDKAVVSVPAGLLSEGEPGDDALKELIKAFESRDTAIREATIRRLIPFPQAAAGPVVEALVDGSLSAQLVCVELLQTWNAPMESLDPWRPETLTGPGMEKLRSWADRIDQTARGPATELTAEQLSSARDQINHLLRAKSEPEQQAALERLARHGELLLPEVARQLSGSITDELRERLTWLRYRLVASDERVLRWPGGLRRLSSADPQVRLHAADQIARSATRDDRQLLLELFSDPEPLVREISLAALQQIGGSEARDALIKLLEDPDANVRAAVLKQIGESPSDVMAESVAAYVANEKDEDLVVHAVRVLRESRKESVVDALVLLFEHSSWRVRAEAAEAMGKMLANSNAWTKERKSRACDGIIKLLKDEDSFVVSRAMTALRSGGMYRNMDPDQIGALIEANPELASEAMPMLTGRFAYDGLSHIPQEVLMSSGIFDHRRSRPASDVAPVLRELCKHRNDEVRASAIAGLCQVAGKDAADELVAAFNDPSGRVRRAAAEALFAFLTRESITGNAHSTIIHLPQNEETDEETDDVLVGPVLPGRDDNNSEWMGAMIEPLLRMLEVDAIDEQFSAALPLIAMGHPDKGFPVVMDALEGESAYVPSAIGALRWLPLEERLTLFKKLVDSRPDPMHMHMMAMAMAQTQDGRAVDALWDLLGDSGTSAEMASSIQFALMQGYQGLDIFASSRNSAARNRAAEDARKHLKSDSELQQLVALVILISASKDEAVREIDAMLRDPATSDEMLRDAFKLRMASESESASVKEAVELLKSDRPILRKAVLAHLAEGDRESAMGMLTLRDGQFSAYVITSPRLGHRYVQDEPIRVRPPEGLTTEMIHALRDSMDESDDSISSAYLDYFLVLLDEKDSLDRLIARWHRNSGDASYARLVYRAVSYTDDDSLVPVLKLIFEQADESGIDHFDFYRTLRSMSGKKVRAFRKSIDDQINIRNNFSFFP